MLAFALLVALYGVNFYIGRRFPYKKVHWFFEVSHFLAGFLLAAFFADFFVSAFDVVLAAVLVGLLWELFEVITDRVSWLRHVMKPGPITPADTLLDLILDAAGALLFTVLF